MLALLTVAGAALGAPALEPPSVFDAHQRLLGSRYLTQPDAEQVEATFSFEYENAKQRDTTGRDDFATARLGVMKIMGPMELSASILSRSTLNDARSRTPNRVSLSLGYWPEFLKLGALSLGLRASGSVGGDIGRQSDGRVVGNGRFTVAGAWRAGRLSGTLATGLELTSGWSTDAVRVDEPYLITAASGARVSLAQDALRVFGDVYYAGRPGFGRAHRLRASAGLDIALVGRTRVQLGGVLTRWPYRRFTTNVSGGAIIALSTPIGSADTDGDSFVDDFDACPDAPGETDYQGCPFVDEDEDGVYDPFDACPGESGAASNAGCPPLDTDGDGTLDVDELCIGSECSET